jgi:hypothetical protein
MTKAHLKVMLFFILLGIPGAVIVARMNAPTYMFVLTILAFIVSALLGILTSKPVGLFSVILNRFSGEKQGSLLSAFYFAIIGGLILGILSIISGWLFEPIVPKNYFKGISVWQAMLHGGIYEEIIFRWGCMSLILFVIWKVFDKSNLTPGPGLYWISIFLSSIPFSLVHLLNIRRLAIPWVSPATIYLLALNLVAGMVLGWLYWKKGLESAILAHMSGHIVIFLYLWI